MRLLSRKEFMKLPSGVLFFKSPQDGVFDHLAVKGTSYPLETDSICRDGIYDDDEVFMVLERRDLVALSKVVEEAFSSTPVFYPAALIN